MGLFVLIYENTYEYISKMNAVQLTANIIQINDVTFKERSHTSQAWVKKFAGELKWQKQIVFVVVLTSSVTKSMFQNTLTIEPTLLHRINPKDSSIRFYRSSRFLAILSIQPPFDICPQVLKKIEARFWAGQYNKAIFSSTNKKNMPKSLHHLHNAV